MTAPTESPGIDKLIAWMRLNINSPALRREPEYTSAIFDTLIDWKRIKEAKVPEKPDIGRMSDLNALGTMIDAYDTLLDLLRRETAKNERIKELLREAYEVYAGMEGVPEPQTACEAYLLRIIMEMQKPLSAALLAEVEREK